MTGSSAFAERGGRTGRFLLTYWDPAVDEVIT
jgi:hypothetical protein